MNDSKREQLKQDAIRAFEQYQKTGLHATEQEVDEWMAELAKGVTTEPPICHL